MWWSENVWEALTDPLTCGMCADSHLDENEHSILVASTATTHVRLARNQAHRGYCVVILREHVTELGDLSHEHLSAFWADAQRTGRAIQAVFNPRKIDYLVMGHRMPHLHCHVFPQHSSEDPKRNVDISDGSDHLPPLALREDAQAIRHSCDAQPSSAG